MKKQVTLLLAAITIFTATKAQDTITNPGFERWINQGTYDDAQGWNTLNPLTNALGTVVAFKATGADAHSGDNAIKLISKNILNTPTASLVTTGTVNIQQQSVDGGYTISVRPVALGGWYKYAPVDGDSATFSIQLTKWDGTNRILVGAGGIKTGVTQSSYTAFSVPIGYLTADVPDTVQILFVSSGENFAHVGTTLFIDDVFYDFSTGINESLVAETSLFPNPAEGNATLKFTIANNEVVNINLYNTLGQQVRNLYTGHTGNGANQIQFSTTGLPAGVYIVQLTAGAKTYNQQLVVK